MNHYKSPYPLATVIFAIVALGYFYVLSHPHLMAFYQLPQSLFTPPIQIAVAGVFIGIVSIELIRYRLVLRHQREDIRRVKIQVDELLDQRKQLNVKNHLYAGHAEKLKLFISDKLLEYIEYDEKFLHFKSIASEVRHNGVICYDKIKTALNQQLMLQTKKESETYESLSEAKDSLMYLWDLLDLSTADNIAMHIANQVCEQEERLFHNELVHTEPGAADSMSFADKPIFIPAEAVKQALSRCFSGAISDNSDGIIKIDEHAQAWVSLNPTDELLGNANHLVLALENILHNAQFFAGRRGDKQKRPSIAIELDQLGGYVSCRIYNRGPHIDELAAPQIFQLGYSTRRVKGNHGKGLGLYFVNEIIKGYDGKINFTNIHNHADVLSLRLERDSGEVITDVIELVIVDGLPLCRKSGGDSAGKTLDWQLAGRLVSVEITHQSNQKTHRLGEEAIATGEILDPTQPAHPRWSLDIKQKSRQTTLHFKPLNIIGVEFTVRLPSLKARLEGDLLIADEEAMNQQVDDIHSQFKNMETWSE